MAFLKQGGETAKKGEFFVIGRDRDKGTDVRVRVRAVSEKRRREIESRYGRPKDVELSFEDDKGQKGAGVFRQNVMSNEDLRQIQRDVAVEAWTDTENFTIAALDEETLKEYRVNLGFQDAEIGVDVSLDGKMTPAIARFLCDNNTELSKAIAGFASDQAKKESGIEANLRKN